jgi:hypothetical protein
MIRFLIRTVVQRRGIYRDMVITATEEHVFIPGALNVFAPAPFTGFVRKPKKPYGYGKSFNYIHTKRRTWFRIYKFLQNH